MKYGAISEAMKEDVASQPYNVMAAFEFILPELSKECMTRHFGRLVGNLRREVFGKNSKRRLAVLPVLEGKLRGDNRYMQRPHIHALICLPGTFEQNRTLLKNQWRDLPLGGDPDGYGWKDGKETWCVNINSDELKLIQIGYVLKQCPNDVDRVLWDYFHKENTNT